jgi:hypothetical protein
MLLRYVLVSLCCVSASGLAGCSEQEKTTSKRETTITTPRGETTITLEKEETSTEEKPSDRNP